jgi:hypothetical protein
MAASFDLLTGLLSVQPILRAINNVGSLVITQDGEVGFEQDYTPTPGPSPSGFADFLLMEDGSKLLQEDGGGLRLNSFALLEDGGYMLQEDGGLLTL